MSTMKMNSKIQIYAFLTVIILVYGVSKFNKYRANLNQEIQQLKEKGDILIGKSSNIKQILSENPYVLVKFYAPWCEPCKEIVPFYKEAATILKSNSPPIVLVDIDCDTQQERILLNQFDIKVYPTILFFIHGEPITFGGELKSAEGIVSWCNKKIRKTTIEFTSNEEIADFIDQSNIGVIFFGEKNSKEHVQFELSSKYYEDQVYFGYVFDPSLFKEYKVKKANSIVMFKQFDERRNEFNSEKRKFESKSIKDFIEAHRYKQVADFAKDTDSRIFAEQRPAMVLFMQSTARDMKDHDLVEFQKVAKKLKGKILFVAGYITDENSKQLANFVGIKPKDCPAVRIINPKGKIGAEKYQMQEGNSKITSDALEQFYNDFKANKLQNIIKSEPIPTSQDHPVYTLVANNFFKVVKDKQFDVFVKFYAPWCHHCQLLAPIYDNLAKKLKNNKNIIIAEIDLTANDVNGLNVTSYPTLKLYTKDFKVHGIDYLGDRTEEAMLAFLKKHTAHKWINPISEQDL